MSILYIFFFPNYSNWDCFWKAFLPKNYWLSASFQRIVLNSIWLEDSERYLCLFYITITVSCSKKIVKGVDKLFILHKSKILYDDHLNWRPCLYNPYVSLSLIRIASSWNNRTTLYDYYPQAQIIQSLQLL